MYDIKISRVKVQNIDVQVQYIEPCQWRYWFLPKLYLNVTQKLKVPAECSLIILEGYTHVIRRIKGRILLPLP